MTGVAPAGREAASGMALHLEGLRTLARERGLWAPAAVPLALGVLALGVAALGIGTHAGALWEWTTGWRPGSSSRQHQTADWSDHGRPRRN